MLPENLPLLKVENLHVAYGSVQAVSGVSFCLHAGEIVSIVGANGAGKTSLIRCIAGMVPARTGQIILDSEDITHLPSFEVCERGIVQVAEEDGCDLIFIGSHGRSGLSRLLLGSVTAKVLSLATTAVLVYRVKEDKS